MIGESLRAALKLEGHAVDWVTDAQAASATTATERFDLVLLDIGLPKGNGLDVLRGIRARNDSTPVIVLTARDALGDRVAGLDAGADDYLAKPFELDELTARIRAVTRRHAGRGGEPALEHGGLRLDPATRQAPATSTLHDVNRETILKALRDSHGIVGGPSGAAARLGLKRTTLQSLMRRLGIRRPSY